MRHTKEIIALWVGVCCISAATAAERPNILWITSEDNSCYLGCYGDAAARTPNIDRLARDGVRFLNCFSNAAVCAPARQTLIGGMYATSIGGQHMRSHATFPEGVSYFPKLLRDAGYYTTNNSKTDYNGDLRRMRAENDRHVRAIRDSVFFPEGMSGRSFEAFQDDGRYPLDRLIRLAGAVSDRKPDNLPQFQQAMTDANPCVRYWGVTGCVVLGRAAAGAERQLMACVGDSEPVICIQAARALAGMGKTEAALPVIRREIENGNARSVLQATLAIDECNLLQLDPSLRSTLARVKDTYASRIVKKLLRE